MSVVYQSACCTGGATCLPAVCSCEVRLADTPPPAACLPACSMMFIDFNEFTTNTPAVVRQVLEFVGADPALLKFKNLPPSMQVGRWAVGGGRWVPEVGDALGATGRGGAAPAALKNSADE